MNPRCVRATRPLICISFLLAVALCLFSCTSGADAQASALHAEYFQIAETWASMEKYDKAIPYYQKAAANSAYANASRWGLARMYALTGKWMDSLSLLEEMHRSEPDNVQISTALAYAYAKNNKTEEAVSEYRSIYENNPDNPDYGLNYGEILFAAGQFDDAVALCESLKIKFPDDAKAANFDTLAQRARAAGLAKDVAQKVVEQPPAQNQSD